MAMASPASPSSSMQNALQAAEQLSAALAEQANRQNQQHAQAAHMNGFAQQRPPPPQQQQQPPANPPLLFQPQKQHSASPSSLVLNTSLYTLPPIPAAMRQLHPAMMEQQHTQSIVHHNQHFYAPAPAARGVQHQPATLNSTNRPYPFVTSSPFALLQQPQPLSALQSVSRSSSASSSPASSAPASGASSPTSSPTVNGMTSNGVLNLFDLLEHMRSNIARIRSPILSAQLGQQLKGLHDQMLRYRMRHEQGEDMNREAHIVYREMRQFDDQISKNLTAQNEHAQLLNLVNFKAPANHTPTATANSGSHHVIKPIPTTLLQQQHSFQAQPPQQQPNGISLQHLHTNGHSGAVAAEVEREKGKEREKEAKKEKKRKRKESKDRTTEEDEERRARKKKRRESEDTEARERRKRKKEKRKAREARKLAQEKERAKEKKRKKHKAKQQQQNGHGDSSSSSSSSSASDSSDESSDNDSSGKKSVGRGKKTQLSSSEKEQTVQALIATLHSKREMKKKKKGSKDTNSSQQLTEQDATPAASVVVAAAIPAITAITTSYRPPPFTISEFADAFRHLTPTQPTLPAPFPRPAAITGQLICPPKRQAVHVPPRADDDRVVQQHSALLSTFTFSPAAVRAIMQRAMPAYGECSEEAVQLVTQSVCQFVAYITDEAESDIHMDDEEDTTQPLQSASDVMDEHLSEDELPLSRSLRPPPLENERGEQKEQSIEPPSRTAVPESASSSSSSSDEISSEKVLDALLRLGYDDYAVLSAHHIQRYRRQQQQPGGLLSPVPRVRTEGGETVKEELPVNLSSSYLLANAHRVDMSRFLPSIPRHPVSDPRIELSVSTSTIALLPSASYSSFSLSTSTSQLHKAKIAAASTPSTPTSARQPDSPAVKKPSKKRGPKPADPSLPPKKPKYDPANPATSEASRVKSAVMKAAWSRKHALMKAGLTKQQASEQLRREKEDERRARQTQRQKSGKTSTQQKTQQLSTAAAASGVVDGKDVGSETDGVGVGEVAVKEDTEVAVSVVEPVIDLGGEDECVV